MTFFEKSPFSGLHNFESYVYLCYPSALVYISIITKYFLNIRYGVHRTPWYSRFGWFIVVDKTRRANDVLDTFGSRRSG